VGDAAPDGGNGPESGAQWWAATEAGEMWRNFASPEGYAEVELHPDQLKCLFILDVECGGREQTGASLCPRGESTETWFVQKKLDRTADNL
jgi:hypothetical protein